MGFSGVEGLIRVSEEGFAGLGRRVLEGFKVDSEGTQRLRSRTSMPYAKAEKP